MGVIQRQSIKHTIIQYAGIGVGALSMLFVYPKALDVYGLAQSLIAASSFVAPIIMLGIPFLSIRFFPVFSDPSKQDNGFLNLMMTVGIAGSLAFALVFPFIQDAVIHLFTKAEKSDWHRQFVWVVLPISVSIVFARLFALHASNYQRVVVPSLFEDFLIKLTLPALIVLFAFHHIGAEDVVWGVVLTYNATVVGTLGYLIWLGKFHWKPQYQFLKKPLVKDMTRYASFGTLNAVGIKSAFFTDILFVSTMLDFQSAGVFSLYAFMADTIAKPVRSIITISQPLIAKAFTEKRMEEVEKIYKKSSINLLILGLFLTIGIWACLFDVLSFMENSEILMAGAGAVYFLCISKLVDMATSVNSEIIAYSEFYRFNLYALFIISAINIVLNYFLIPGYGLTGAAFATFISWTLFNAVKLIFIKIKFGLLPVTKETWILVAAAGAIYGATFLIPNTGSAVINILVKSIFIGLTYPALVFKLKVSEEYNQLMISLLRKIGIHLKR